MSTNNPSDILKKLDIITEAVRLGAPGYLVKPFKSEEILNTVRKNLK